VSGVAAARRKQRIGDAPAPTGFQRRFALECVPLVLLIVVREQLRRQMRRFRLVLRLRRRLD
jgi:hypothetical protein